MHLQHRLPSSSLLTCLFTGIGALLLCCALSGRVYSAPAAAPSGIVAKPGKLPVPVLVNQFYELPLLVTNTDGIGVAGLRLQIRGRMPEHAHGLPTEPQITDKGQGRYQVKGLSFNMPGRWVIEILNEGKTLLRQELQVQF